MQLGQEPTSSVTEQYNPAQCGGQAMSALMEGKWQVGLHHKPSVAALPDDVLKE